MESRAESGSGGHIASEPVKGALHDVAAVLGVGKAVALVGIDHELGGDLEGAKCMPELERLGSGTLAIAVADNGQGWGVGLLDEGDGGAFGVDGGVIVDGGAEVGNHPLVDGVLAVVALPV
jgi:hypothetical protein